MFDNQIFYHQMSRKYIVAMGALFNNIYIQHFLHDGDTVATSTQKVPLTFGPKEHFIAKFSAPESANIRIAQYLPRIAFTLTGMPKDPTRQVDGTRQIRAQDDADKDVWKYVNTPVPHKFIFEMSILGSHMDHTLQILEQILAYFQTQVTLNIKELPALGVIRECPIHLTSNSPTMQVEYDEQSDAIYSWDLEFEVDGYLYPYVTDAKLIKKIKTYFYDKQEMLDYIALIEQDVNPLTAGPDDAYTVDKTVTEV